MNRMKTFLLYAILIAGFIGLSWVLENGLIASMYKNIAGTINTNFAVPGERVSDFEINKVEAKASNVSGYIKMSIKNTTGKYVDECYIKIQLHTKLGLLATTKYYGIKDFEAGETRNLIASFQAYEIARYDISFAGTYPDKEYIISIFGYDINLKDVFGIDLTKFINIDAIKTAGSSAWSWAVALVKSVPLWAYWIAGLIVLWHLPARYLFGIFPF